MPPPPITLGITGISGFLGRVTARAAESAGYRVVGFSRTPERLVNLSGCHEGRRFAFGETPDFTGLDAIVHLAGESIFGLWTAAKRQRILHSRQAGTRAVVQGIASLERPIPLISASAVGYYGDTGEREADETFAPGDDFLARVCQEWEAEACAAEALGARVVILRFGIVLGEEGGMLAKIRPLFRLGLGGPLGSGSQWMSWIAVEDAARLILACATRERASGIYNAVSPTPLRNRDFTRSLAHRWHRPALLTVPAFVLRGVLGELGAMVLQSQRVTPRRTLALPFAYDTPELKTHS